MYQLMINMYTYILMNLANQFAYKKRLAYSTKNLIVPLGKWLFTGTVPANKNYVTGTVGGGGREGGREGGKGRKGLEGLGESGKGKDI